MSLYNRDKMKNEDLISGIHDLFSYIIISRSFTGSIPVPDSHLPVFREGL